MVTEWWRAGRSVTAALWPSVETSAVSPPGIPRVARPAPSQPGPPVLPPRVYAAHLNVSSSSPA